MGVFDAIASALGLGYQVYKDTSLTPAEREANAFTAQQAQLNRNFEAQQAEIARDWQEQQYLQHNSPAAMMRQYQDAGINPALMFGGTMPSASTSTGIPSGSSASSVAPSGAGNMVAMLAQLGDVISNIQLRKKQSENVDASTNRINQEIEWNPQLWENEIKSGFVSRENLLSGIRKINSEIDLFYSEKNYKDISSAEVSQRIKNLIKEGENIDARTASEFIHQAVMSAQTVLAKQEASKIRLDVLEKEFDNELLFRTGVHGSQPIWNAVTDALRGPSSHVTSLLENAVSTVKSWFNKK